MYRDAVIVEITAPFLTTSEYENSENGAASPGRWQYEQFL
jgi:hypothetical protein